MHIVHDIPGRVVASGEARYRLTVPLAIMIAEGNTPRVHSITLESVLLSGRAVNFDPAVEVYPRHEGGAPPPPIRYPIILRPQDTAGGNELDLVVELEIPADLRGQSPLVARIDACATFHAFLRVRFRIDLQIVIASGRVVVQQVQRSDQPSLIRLNFFLLSLLLVGCSFWNEVFNKDVFGATWLTAHQVDKFLFFCYGFFGLSTVLVLIRNLNGLQSLWAFPEIYLRAETSRFLDSRRVTLGLLLITVVAVALISGHLSVRRPNAPPGLAWFDAEHRRIENERVRARVLPSLTLRCGVPQGPAAALPVLGSGNVFSVLPWRPTSDFRPACQQLTIDTGLDVKGKVLSAGCGTPHVGGYTRLKISACDVQVDRCLTEAARDELERQLCGGASVARSDFVLERHEGLELIAHNPETLQADDLQEQVIALWDKAMGAAPKEDLVDSASFEPEQLAGLIPSDLPTIEPRAFEEIYRSAVGQLEDPSLGTRQLTEMAALALIYKRKGARPLSREFLERIARDFEEFYSSPRGLAGVDGRRERYGDRAELEAYLRFLLQLEAVHFASPDVQPLADAIENVVANSGDDIYFIFLRQCALRGQLFRKRQQIDVLEARREFLRESILRVASGPWIREALRDLAEALKNGSKATEERFVRDMMATGAMTAAATKRGVA